MRLCTYFYLTHCNFSSENFISNKMALPTIKLLNLLKLSRNELNMMFVFVFDLLVLSVKDLKANDYETRKNCKNLQQCIILLIMSHQPAKFRRE